MLLRMGGVGFFIALFFVNSFVCPMKFGVAALQVRNLVHAR